VVLLLRYRLFTKGFDQSPPRQVCLDNVFVVLGEAGDGAGLLKALVEMIEPEEASAL
jgi:hypothetical protein